MCTDVQSALMYTVQLTKRCFKRGVSYSQRERIQGLQSNTGFPLLGKGSPKISLLLWPTH